MATKNQESLVLVGKNNGMVMLNDALFERVFVGESSNALCSGDRYLNHSQPITITL